MFWLTILRQKQLSFLITSNFSTGNHQQFINVFLFPFQTAAKTYVDPWSNFPSEQTTALNKDNKVNLFIVIKNG